MQYQIFVENQSDKHFTASVLGMQSIAVAGSTEAEAINNAKEALRLQLSKGKIVTVNIDESEKDASMQHAGILESDPTFDDWLTKLTAIRQSANEFDDGI
jgi:predicted RNase H-like HicB family nuclease